MKSGKAARVIVSRGRRRALDHSAYNCGASSGSIESPTASRWSSIINVTGSGLPEELRATGGKYDVDIDVRLNQLVLLAKDVIRQALPRNLGSATTRPPRLSGRTRLRRRHPRRVKTAGSKCVAAFR